MTWSEFKAKVEALGVLDDTLVGVIDVDATTRREDDEHEIRALTMPYPGVAIVDDRAESRKLPGPGHPLQL